jgi:hypothetical protein
MSSELAAYVLRVRDFSRRDWAAYVAWVGLMLGLCAATGGFLLLGSVAGVEFPAAAWCVPIGAGIFTASIAVDTIGHRTIYRVEIAGAETLVHDITIFCGVASCVLLCAAYAHRDLLWIPAMVLTVLSFVYSMVDEVLHWRRYLAERSDRIEMSSHVGILIGHGTMMLGWWTWFFGGYGGVAETLAHLASW